MTQHCTRCEGSGFLNLEQVSDATLKRFDQTGDPQVILDWIEERDAEACRVRRLLLCGHANASLLVLHRLCPRRCRMRLLR